METTAALIRPGILQGLRPAEIIPARTPPACSTKAIRAELRRLLLAHLSLGCTQGPQGRH
eukprot:7565189-Pyramimonas_sp.AAC.1